MKINKATETAILKLVSTTTSANGTTSLITKSGWSLVEGLTHLASVPNDGPRWLSLMQTHGIPTCYEGISSCRHSRGETDETDHDNNSNHYKPQTCFQSLCRIIAGQQLAGAAAMAIWKRLIDIVAATNAVHKGCYCAGALTPSTILQLAQDDLETKLRQPAGLSNAKARSIVALATAFEEGSLTEDLLLGNQKNENNQRSITGDQETEAEQTIRKALLSIKGIGPWSCDMFLLFTLERPDVFPVGDLGVRKGLQRFFQMKKGHGYGGTLCPKKDLSLMNDAMEVYRPYRSLVTSYLWKVADTKDVYHEENKKTKQKTKTPTTTATTPKKSRQSKRKATACPVTTGNDDDTGGVSTPKKKRTRRSVKVTP